MSRRRRKEIKRHLTEDELDEKLAEVDDDEIVRRLTFLKNLYRDDLIKEAANRVGRSESTGGRWADRWNENGLEGLAPSFGGGSNTSGRPRQHSSARTTRISGMSIHSVRGLCELL